MSNVSEPITSPEEWGENYVMGRSAEETRRLSLQAALYATHSKHLLKLASIGPGMRVLDVGCGAGDVTQLVAQLVGPTGHVLGVDADADMVAVAERNISAAGLGNVTFRQGNLLDCTPDQPVDAVVGRLILMHLDNPVAAVRTLARHVRPGGVVSFQDFNFARTGSVPVVPLIDMCGNWIRAGFRTGGIDDPGFGLQLSNILSDAGLSASQMELVAPTGDADSLHIAHMVETVRTLLPLIEKSGVTTRPEIDLDTLHERLTQECRKAEAVLYPPELVGAWASVPAH